MREADLLRKEPRGGKSAGHGKYRAVEREGGGDAINFMVISCNL